MTNHHTRTVLMAGAATFAMTAAAFASEFSNVLVFGDRFLDAGQYVSPESVFPPEGEEFGDRRERFTNRVQGGGDGNTWGTLVSRNLGYGDTLPSQPSISPDDPEIPRSGSNYAAGFRDARSIRNSILSTSDTFTIRYRDEDGTIVLIPGNSRPGLLVDPERRGWAADSIVIINGGARDIQRLANVERNLSNRTDPLLTSLVRNSLTRETIADTAALDIAGGATALRGAGASLVVVSNLHDVGNIPEAGTEGASAEQALNELDADIAADPTLAGDALVIQARQALMDIIANPDDVATFRTEGTNRFNATLSQALDGQDGVVVLDQNALVAEVIQNPGAFGLSTEFVQNTDCLDSGPLFPCSNEVEASVADALFVDGYNFTTTGHRILADHAASVINAPVQISGVPFTAIASGREVTSAVEAQVVPERIGKRGWAPFVSANVGQSTWNEISGEGRQGALRISGVGGAKYDFGNGVAVGAAAAYQDISDSLSGTAIDYDGSAVYGSLFAGVDFGRIFGNASATYGRIDYDRIARQSRIGAATIENGGSSDANVFGASLEVGVRALNKGILSAGPIAALDHYSASVDEFSEDGASFTAVDFDDVDARSTTASLGLFIEGGDINSATMPVVFRAKALYTRELDTEGDTVTARAASSPNNTFSREGRGAQADSLTVGAQLTYNFGSFIGSLGYDGRIGESDDHVGRVDISVPLGSGS